MTPKCKSRDVAQHAAASLSSPQTRVWIKESNQWLQLAI